MKTYNKEVLKKVYQKFGSTADFNLTGDYKYLKGLGPYETLNHNERSNKRYLLLPKMQLNLKRPVRFENIEYPSDEIRRKNVLGISWQARSFVNGMSPVTSECLSGPAYIYEAGLRKVEPYFNCLSNTASPDKYPGANIKLADYFTIRFPAFTRRYFEMLIEKNQIVVNTDHVDPEYVVKKGDVISHLFHQHENDITDSRVDIIYENEDFVVVDKPSSWPVYPVGNFKFNSLQFIMLREYGYRDLRTVHRIDAATSGICILAKKNGVTGKLQKYFREGVTTKQYLALVDGCFREGAVVCEEPLTYFKISPKKFIRESSPRTAKTVFTRLSYDPATNTSLLLCVPVTGRTHQIRLHLASLGHFIVNDSLYNEMDFEDERTEIPEEKLTRVLEEMEKNVYARPILDTSRPFSHQYCVKCQAPDIFPNQQPSSMCLHSYKYSLGDDFYFESRSPDWVERPSYIIHRRTLRRKNLQN